MDKKVIKQDKVTVVILKDSSYYPTLVVKGVSKCDDRDEYSEEIGEKIANARAWVKYYEHLSKYSKAYIEDLTEAIKLAEKRLDEHKSTLKYADTKKTDIEKELAELVK